jgi:hypothetical protein
LAVGGTSSHEIHGREIGCAELDILQAQGMDMQMGQVSAHVAWTACNPDDCWHLHPSHSVIYSPFVKLQTIGFRYIMA